MPLARWPRMRGTQCDTYHNTVPKPRQPSLNSQTKLDLTIQPPSPWTKQPQVFLQPMPIGRLVELDKWLRSWFSIPFSPSPTPSNKQSHLSTYLNPQGKAIPTSNHNLWWWLVALKKLFQNTAWDRWWCRISVPWQGWDPKPLTPANNM